MKLFLNLLVLLLFTSGCVQSVSLLGPASTAGGGNVVRSAFSSAVTYGVKKQTGKFPSEHAMTYIKENNPQNMKENNPQNNKNIKCVEFLEASNNEICTAIKKNILEAKKNIIEKSKIKFLNQR